MIAALRSRRRPVLFAGERILPRPTVQPEPVEACTSVLVHGVGILAVRYSCTLPAPHEGRRHEHRPRPGRMAVAEWS